MPAAEFAFEALPLAPGFTLHVHSSDRRKTNSLALFWVGDLDRDVTERALLPSLLLRGTKSFPTMRDLTCRKEFLYGASLGGDCMKIGERHVIALRAEFVNDRYLPAGEAIFAPFLALFGEVTGAPALESGAFPEQTLGVEKENHRRLIESLFNDKGSWALERCIREMCAREAFRFYEYGDVADLPAITGAGMAARWRRVRERGATHLYCSGHLTREEMVEGLSVLAEGRGAVAEAPKALPAHVRAGEVRRVEEQLVLNQGKLVLGFRTETRFGDPHLEALTVANGILGQFPHSKLFVNVREKASLCYSVHSTLDRTQGLLFITAGIDPAKRAQAEELILKQLGDLQAGEFEDEVFTATKLAYDNRLLMLEDTPRALMDVDLTWRLAGADYRHERYRARLAAVTREQVIEAARRVRLDTAYFLSPGKEG